MITYAAIVLGKERSNDLPKMSQQERRTDRELEGLRPQNDPTAIAPVGLSESGLSAPVAERTPESPCGTRVSSMPDLLTQEVAYDP